MDQHSPVSRKKLQFGGDTMPKSISPHHKIGSYVFFKCHVSDTSHPNITEIAMVSLSEHDINHQGSGDNSGKKHLEPEIRYKDMLVLSFDPNEEIHVQDSVNSDLNLAMLKHSKKLSFTQNSLRLIDEFLQTQRSPVCLISHSGNYLDFRFLKTATNRLGMNLLDGNLLCVDTVDMFAKIDSDQNTACLLDSKRYSLDNVYRRCFGELPFAPQYDAKSLVMQLINIYKSALHNSLDPPRLKYFSNVGTPISRPSSTQSSPHLLSPMKKIILDSELNSEDTTGRILVDTHPQSVVAQENGNTDPTATVETFVFLDLETTGLDTDMDNIIEICACAVHRHDLGYFDMAGKEVDLKQVLPRLVDQISLMVLPLCEISVGAAQVHGIVRQELLLRQKQCFTINTARMLENFLLQQKEPICLVAHNGFKFDYPMLLTHLDRTITNHPIWNRIFCTDSLVVLRENFPYQSNRLTNVYNNLAGQVKGPISQSHSAEGDVLRLIVIARLQKQMIEWLENKKIRFDELKKNRGSGGNQSSQ